MQEKFKGVKMEFKIRAIRTKDQYQEYLWKVNQLMDLDPEPESSEGILLETLAILIDEYESRLGYDIPLSNDPLLVVKRRMEDLDLKQKDLIPAIGDKSVVSRILKGERKLTYDMIGPLSELLKVPVELLIKRDPAIV